MDLNAMRDEQVLGFTGWAEARGDVDFVSHTSLAERVAVMCVVRNRLQHFQQFRALSNTYLSVCLAPNQFSCWSPTGGRENYTALQEQITLLSLGRPIDGLLRETIFLARGIVSGDILDVTGGATMYYSPRSMTPPDAVPVWARGRVDWLGIGSQKFFKV